MTPIIIGKATLYNMDCMELLKDTPDKFYDLAIVDPPYGLGTRLVNGGSTSAFIKSQNEKLKEWDNATPNDKYFEQLKRASKNQIIWGGNYFNLLPCRCFVVWDKTIHGNTYADADFAWTSFNTPARVYKENIAVTTSEGRIHPTQKSIKLYEWLLSNYAKQGDKILDTHLGSMSSVIACLNLGYEITGCELDADYFQAGIKRVEQSQKQERLFA